MQDFNRQNFIVNEYHILGEIGSGSTSRVHLAVNILTQQQLTVKIIAKNSLPSEKELEFFRSEIRIMQSLNNQYIVKFISLQEDESNFYVFMEYCKGESLQQYILRHKKLSLSKIIGIYRQICRGVQYLHSIGVAHRDLKPENIIICANNGVKIIDFGLSTDNANNLRETFCGSLVYAAPECINREPYYATKSDMWSLGIILFCMAYGRCPWKSKNTYGVIEEITHEPVNYPGKVYPMLEDTMRKLLVKNPDKRLTADELLREDWLVETDTPYSARAPRTSNIRSIRSLGSMRFPIISGSFGAANTMFNSSLTPNHPNLVVPIGPASARRSTTRRNLKRLSSFDL